MNFVLGARVRIFTIPGRRGRMGRVGMSVGAAHLDLRKRQEDSAGKQRFYGERVESAMFALAAPSGFR